ncbi:hypothetical protein HNQ80_000358 [Anaerosolibacter carboniphilus]|uniref:Uncharacterized protein n=1 Tax=Anaerosolibacter carboniphilus TaxID=1417629 RepID=A0A841KVR9_9FIRM|nr:hypothetical protein [Anaerosolibacter carboniphilus]MBB6214289.1 hypothetical protein [Anaerosolibacter carboniphilus]
MKKFSRIVASEGVAIVLNWLRIVVVAIPRSLLKILDFALPNLFNGRLKSMPLSLILKCGKNYSFVGG